MKYKHSAQFYKDRYAKYASTIKSMGLIPIKEGAFISRYEELLTDPKNPSKNPMKDIIYSARYSTRYNTALAEKKALAKIGIKVKLEDLKNITTTEFADKYSKELAKEYRALKKAGNSGKAAELLISQQWFGSN